MRAMARFALVGLRPRREPGWLLRAGLLAILLLALALVIIARATAPEASAAQALVGKPAPSFALSAAQGGAVLPLQMRFTGAGGRPTLLVFFNTLCVRCLGEIGAARQAAASERGGLVDLIYIDTPAENAQITGAYMTRLGYDPPVALDRGGALASRYGVGYGPTLVLVDRSGVVRAVWVGATPAATLISGISRALGD